MNSEESSLNRRELATEKLQSVGIHTKRKESTEKKG